MFTELDIDNWPRKTTYEFFRDYEDPFFNITANVDVTNLYKFSKKNSLSFALTALFCSLRAANEIREFRIRLLDGRLVEFDTIHATQTILNSDETFSFSYFEMKGDVSEFDISGKAALAKYRGLRSFDVEADRYDLIYYSVVPWVSFTSIKHATRHDNTHTIPRIVFGKMFDDGPVRKMPLSVEANHMIMDGIHAGRFFVRFQEIADSF